MISISHHPDDLLDFEHHRSHGYATYLGTEALRRWSLTKLFVVRFHDQGVMPIIPS